MIDHPKFKIAAMHVSPVFMDTAKTIEKTCSLIQEAASNGARLAAFPEAYVPAFPIWSALRAPIHNHQWFCQLAAQSIHVNGPELARVAAAARRHKIFVSLGFNESSSASDGCIWNSNVMIGDDGSILNHHRKLMPTFWEKLVWATGDGAGLRVVQTSIGRLGMLICGENTNPLARFSLMAQSEQVHISSFPPVWPAHDPAATGAYDVADAIRIRVRNHSFEGKLFNVVASAYLDRATLDGMSQGDTEVARMLHDSPRGVSMIVGPNAVPIGEEMQDAEGILYADVDLAQTVEPRQLQDVAGYYNRFDVFRLTVNRTANCPATFIDLDHYGQVEPRSERELSASTAGSGPVIAPLGGSRMAV